MSKRSSIEKSKYIDSRYKEYLRSSFKFGNERLQTLFEKQLQEEKLFKGPYVDLSLPFKRGKNIKELISEGVVCKSFLKLGDINFDRPLYSHQEESIRQIGAGRSAIITTGTGSGKTESFLFPILNDLMKDVENGNNEVGVRAIFLYPMNALVNDQIDRVRKILTNCPDITYGFFTGETKESVAQNYRQKYGEENNTIIPENELVSRKEIRENPPHLLFTNYSMLEYLLIRPNDYAIFEPSRLGNWKYVVLDEAHSYAGSLGIELSLLMRRLTGLAPKKPRFLLTSATLGEQGKSENEIVDFARSLTSVDNFEIRDIIFSKRIHLDAAKIEYSVKGSDYCKIKKDIENEESVHEAAKQYCKDAAGDVKSCLYELLSRDRNVYELYSLLNSGSKSFVDIHKAFEDIISEDELTALIDLINLAEKDGIGLFDLKYHSFVRPLSGAYITIGADQKLSLTKTNTLDGLRAFEVGNCRYCSAPYIIGKIKISEEDGLQYLFQNKEVDIYENYGHNEFVKLDYFLLENSVEEEEVEADILEEYEVCSKCGCINPAQNKNARKCSCGEKYRTIIYRVNQVKANAEEDVFNNINQCPACGHKTRAGAVKGLNLGKDEGTALISQILYEAIDEGEEVAQPKMGLSLKMRPREVVTTSDSKFKQFLAFSDSRQQASFFATFFESNHVRMLQKRLVWKVLEEQNFRDVTVDELAAYLTDKIKKQSLFHNEMTAHKNAWITLLVDLLKVDGIYDGEGLGLYYYDLDISDIINFFTEEQVNEEFGKYNITKADLANVMQVIFSVFKVTPAISYVKSTLTPEEKKDYLEYRRFDNNFVMLQSPKSTPSIRSMLPVAGKENMVVRYIKRTFGCNDEEAKEIITILFDLLVGQAQMPGVEPILIKDIKKEAYQIDVSRYILKNYKTSKYYQCTKCGRLTPYNVHNVCVQDRCPGELVEVDPDEALASNFYRSQYKTKKVESIVVEEHTAQLDRKKAKLYQNDFKDKKINILSCSTTFEMGIDIGNLETVFMRNVPPSPANYVQRAGRAGRRKDSSAYILTYCGTGSHDYTYFLEPEKMISGVIRPPYFNVLNKKIIVRHLMATCLGYFFRNNPAYFDTIDGLVFDDGVEAFKQYVMSHPEDLNDYINKKIIPGGAYEAYRDFKWFDEIEGNDEKMQHFVDSIKELAKEYEDAKQHALNDEKYTEAEYYTRQIDALHKKNLIESLSKYCVIPKYGFPVDVVDLEIYKDGILDGSYDLSRDLRVAISEYAPDSEVIVDKKKYTSKYISLPKMAPFPKRYFRTCPNCNKVNVTVSDRSTECKYCKESLEGVFSEYYIEPVNGFKTGLTKESTRLKPKRSYAGEVTYLGQGTRDDSNLRLGRFITVETSSEDKLLVMNKSNFYMCPVCGYSDIVKGRVDTPSVLKKHNNHKQYECKCEDMEKLRLGHTFETDVARFTIPSLDADAKDGYAMALSFLYAFLEGVSSALGIERNDIDGVLELNSEELSFDVLLYDNVPGGAGHVKRLVNKEAIISSLKAALVKVSQECCDEDTSCYNCLRNYYNQMHHNKLRRSFAKECIESLLVAEDVKAEHFSASTGARNSGVGARQSNYVYVDDGIERNDTQQSLEEMKGFTSDEGAKSGIDKLIAFASGKNYEHPHMEESIQVDVAVWPDMFWPRSKVALFLPEQEQQYERLRVYDWHCYMVNDDIDAESVFANVQEV